MSMSISISVSISIYLYIYIYVSIDTHIQYKHMFYKMYTSKYLYPIPLQSFVSMTWPWRPRSLRWFPKPWLQCDGRGVHGVTGSPGAGTAR